MGLFTDEFGMPLEDTILPIYAQVKRKNPRLKIEIWECEDRYNHVNGGWHWAILAHNIEGDFWYLVEEGLELTIEQAGSKSIHDMKIIKERL